MVTIEHIADMNAACIALQRAGVEGFQIVGNNLNVQTDEPEMAYLVVREFLHKLVAVVTEKETISYYEGADYGTFFLKCQTEWDTFLQIQVSDPVQRNFLVETLILGGCTRNPVCRLVMKNL